MKAAVVLPDPPASPKLPRSSTMVRIVQFFGVLLAVAISVSLLSTLQSMSAIGSIKGSVSILVNGWNSNKPNYPKEWEESALRGLSDFQPARGVRYLYEQYGLLLIVPPRQKEDNVIQIINYYGSNLVCAQMNLRIWVRLASKEEVVAGLATAEGTNVDSCKWNFTPNSLPPTTYEIAVKLLAINDNVSYEKTQCNIEPNKKIVVDKDKGNDTSSGNSHKGTSSKLQKLQMSYTPSSTEFHGAEEVCCEMCTFLKQCTHFHSIKKRNNRGCLFYHYAGNGTMTTRTTKTGSTLLPPHYYAAALSKEDIKVGHMVGTSRLTTKEMIPTKFLGCGYAQLLESNQTFCKANGTDDMPYIVEPIFTVDKTDELELPTIDNKKDLPICPSNLEGVGHGRWVRTASDKKCVYTPLLEAKAFPMTVYNESQPEECWIHDQFTGNLCVDGCPRNPQSNLWKSSLSLEEEYLEYTWQPYNCHLPLYSNTEIQKCFTKQNYAVPTRQGDSVSVFFFEYIKQRFDMLKIDNVQKSVRRQIVISNGGLLHHLWHDSDQVFEDAVSSIPQVNGASNNDQDLAISIFFVGPFLSSERQTHVTQGRLERFSAILSPILKQKGWRELNWINVSMALSYEGATQYDGLHVVGNSMKMAFQMIIHQLCGA